jgi:uncharacterized membrane protein
VLKVKVSEATIQKDLEEHPDYPSLLCVSDVLTGYGIENIACRSTPEIIQVTPVPFIAQIKASHNRFEQFVVVDSIGKDRIHYYNVEKGRWQFMGTAAFIARWSSRIVLGVNAADAKHEKDYTIKKWSGLVQQMIQWFALLLLPAATLLSSLLALFQFGPAAVLPVVYSMITLAGCIVTGLLLWYDLDEYHPLLRKICSTGARVNCNNVLRSRASKFLGISWSSIGLAYYTGTLLTLLLMGLNNSNAWFITAWLNVAAVPYIFYSLYYQWRIARQWCVLCICVQVLLALQCITATVAHWHMVTSPVAVLNTGAIIFLVCMYSIPFLVVNLLMPAYKTAKEYRQYKIELRQLKYNPAIFNAMLATQKEITGNIDQLGITLGNPSAPNKVIKICNPYCGPCASAHIPLEELIHHNVDIQVQIIFMASNKEDDVRTPPVKHFLALAEKKNEALLWQALDDWYGAEKKDYDLFAAKYPMNGELKLQEDKIDAMYNWCRKMEISATPTFFINGYQLPELYSINDLKYYLTA